MAGEHREYQSRLIVTGLDADGRSTFVADGPTTDRLVADGYTRNHLWQATEVPTPVMAPNGPGGASIIPPPPGGYNYVITAFAPESCKRCTIAGAAKPEKIGTCTAPICAQACEAAAASGDIGR